MRNRLIGKEKQFLTDVLKELKQYDISLEERENIKRQMYIIKKYSSQKRWGLLENLKKR